MKQLKPLGIGSAEFSPCLRYRYSLTRDFYTELGKSAKTLISICLNPSTATGEMDDPTVAGMSARALAWGYERYVMLNLFGLRSTDPRGLLNVEDPVGLDNDYTILQTCRRPGVQVICAWGSASKLVPERAEAVTDMLRAVDVKLYYLKMSERTGQPWHPLYLSRKLKPVEWRG